MKSLILIIFICLFISGCSDSEKINSTYRDLSQKNTQAYWDGEQWQVMEFQPHQYPQKKHIETLREAALAIVTFGKKWGLNDKFIEDCRVAWNETQLIKTRLVDEPRTEIEPK